MNGTENKMACFTPLYATIFAPRYENITKLKETRKKKKIIFGMEYPIVNKYIGTKILRRVSAKTIIANDTYIWFNSLFLKNE